MSFAYMPLYTGDYMRDTRHLTPEEHGCYLLLLMYSWDQKGPIPLDERRQCGIVNARGGGEVESLRRVLAEFFVLMDDGYYNPRMVDEIAKFEAISEGRRRGGLEKARRHRDLVRAAVHGAQAQDEHARALLQRVSPSPSPTSSLTPTPTQTQTPTQRRFSVETPTGNERAVANARASRLAQDSLPQAWLDWCTEHRQDLDPAETFQRFRDFWIAKPGAAGRKLDWFATWRNWCRNEKPGNRGQPSRQADLEHRNRQHAAEFARRLTEAARTIDHEPR